MTQRIFDTDNEEDMNLLWSILPDDIVKITPSVAFSFNYGWYRDSGNVDIKHIKIEWHDKTEITRPVDYKSMIGCVGWFWDNDDEEKSLGVLMKYTPRTPFPFTKGNNDNTYSKFRPAKKSELKFWGE